MSGVPLLTVVACAVIGLMNFCMASDKGLNDPGKRFTITQELTSEHGAIYITDTTTGKSISVMNHGKQGAFIGFYDGPPRAGKNGAMPRLAISAGGLQIVTKEGKEKYLDLDKLARLSEILIEGEDERPVREVGEAVGCDTVQFQSGAGVWYPPNVRPADVQDAIDHQQRLTEDDLRELIPAG
jgi:hypothetical protein